MKKNKKVKDISTGESFDSTHELWFSWYIKELISMGYIKKIRREKTYTLFDSIKYEGLDPNNKSKKYNLLSKKEYSDDFGILWSVKAYNIFYQLVQITPKNRNIPFIVQVDLVHSDKPISCIDIKNPHNKSGVKTLFAVNQKWLYQKHNIYVQDIDIESLFIQTFTPERFKFTDSNKSYRQINFKTRTLSEYIKLRTK